MSPRVLREFSEFIQKGREARKIEVNSIWNNPLDAIFHYEEANHLGFTLYQALDLFKSTKVNYFLKKFASKEILIAFLVGILSSYAAGEISKILSPFFCYQHAAPPGLENKENFPVNIFLNPVGMKCW
jgi:hypothetical protein